MSQSIKWSVDMRKHGLGADARRRLRLLASGLIIALHAMSVSAEQPFTQEELLALPRVCLAQKFVNALWLRTRVVPLEEQRAWEQRLGEKDYSHFHHYCGSLIYMKRGNAAKTKTERQGFYRRAITSFEYFQRNASRSFPLMPEVDLQKGLALRLVGEDGRAASEFLDAISLKPNYTPAYSALIDLYLDLGDVRSAKETLRLGLERAPDSKILRQKEIDLRDRETERDR
jgi:tetratricopeptide (TPR) repeat protein